MSQLLDTISSYSGTYLLIAFVLYSVAFILFVTGLTGKKWSGRSPEENSRIWGKRGFIVTVIGLAMHLLFFFTRWYASGHIPTSNMYEFMTCLAMMIILAFVVVYLIYKKTVIGAFAVPVGIVILAYASIFPREIQPLIPALQSYWLAIHVTMASLGDAFFAVAFAGGLMHLVRTVDFSSETKVGRWERRGVELSIFSLVMIIAFVGATFGFNAAGYKAEFSKTEITIEAGVEKETLKKETYVLPPIVKPYGMETVEMKPFLGMKKPLFSTPSWMNGKDAGRKFNTVIWSVIAGLILYGILRLIIRKPIGEAISPALSSLDPDDLDEISYRAVAIGYPIFTLGALIFAMIWAHEAWGRFWGWDPKEVWALITWLFYAAYLHLRLSKGWQGKRSSWMAVIGFIVVVFTLVGVNLIIAGLHSYAGV
ncbi:cytochrome c biogenesis protein CcsA [Paenibacillus sp. J2TS4]|uniref:cytochrome c biogenesis protein CcsA n=1 Tax=Paenibacillus sp. J2TS4 TaxID=2807194 RepID=UPI001B20CF8C|nr:cytochrome c biogenesis protein CcsA [Paenibacillus sp. J2TS4]GIP32353.1 cytochrome c biogenesis protein ResC [Paenibacillus sp. J2TS4]